MKYNEDGIMEDVMQYIKGTYNQHYVGDGSIQTIDFWESLGSLGTTSRDMAIKYLARYGRKEGYNEKDLLKAMHFIVIMMYYGRKGAKPPEASGSELIYKLNKPSQEKFGVHENRERLMAEYFEDVKGRLNE